MSDVAGWYSPRFGERIPATSLIGEGLLSGEVTMETLFEVAPAP